MGWIFAKLPNLIEAEAVEVVAIIEGVNIQRNSSINNLFISPKDRASALARKMNLSTRKFENNDKSNNFHMDSDGVEEVKEMIKVKMKHNGNHVEVGVRERRKEKPNSRLNNLPKNVHGEQQPAWLSDMAGEAIKGWIPQRVGFLIVLIPLRS